MQGLLSPRDIRDSAGRAGGDGSPVHIQGQRRAVPRPGQEIPCACADGGGRYIFGVVTGAAVVLEIDGKAESRTQCPIIDKKSIIIIA